MKPAAPLSSLFIGLLLPLATSAQAQHPAALRQCRAIAGTAARLACYDAIPLAAGPAPVPAAAPAPRPAPPVAALAPVPETQFGLPTPADRVQEIVTRYDGLFEGWRPDERIRLANGQVWQVVDGSSGVYNLKSPQVTIRRGAMGRFVLDVEGANRMPTVRRAE